MEGQQHLSLAEDPVTLCKFSPVVRNISKAIFDWPFKEPSKHAKITEKIIMERAPWQNLLDILFLTLQEHFVYIY